MNFFYLYKIKYCAGTDELVIAEGITYGASWLDVMTHLVKMYGDIEIVEILNLSILGNGGSCLEKKDIVFKEEDKQWFGIFYL